MPDMFATIELADTKPRLHRPRERYRNLLHCFMAVHDSLSHDRDIITFHREDGFTLRINLAVNYASFGPEGKTEDEKLWTENIDDGTLLHLLRLFTELRDKNLLEFDWLSRHD
jgi:hypothetical protein